MQERAPPFPRPFEQHAHNTRTAAKNDPKMTYFRLSAACFPFIYLQNTTKSEMMALLDPSWAQQAASHQKDTPQATYTKTTPESLAHNKDTFYTANWTTGRKSSGQKF